MTSVFLFSLFPSSLGVCDAECNWDEREKSSSVGGLKSKNKNVLIGSSWRRKVNRRGGEAVKLVYVDCKNV